jgi:hypothetical protein
VSNHHRDERDRRGEHGPIEAESFTVSGRERRRYQEDTYAKSEPLDA